MEKYFVRIIHTDFGDTPLLGKKVGDFVSDAFVGRDDFVVTHDQSGAPTGHTQVLLYDNMPLVQPDDILRFAGLMRARNICFLALGKRGGAHICAGVGDGDSGIFATDDAFLQITDAKSFNMVYNLLKDRILCGHISRGVNVFDKATCFIDDTVVIERGVNILPFTRITGTSKLLTGCTVSASYIENGWVGESASVEYSHLKDSVVGAHAKIGPFARLRGAKIGEGCRVGDFVEVKASEFGEDVKAAHLTYVGDAKVGDGTNIGCGTVFCNYDGSKKHVSQVGKNCFIGANTNLIAPLNVGDGAFIAAGTTVTDDVGEGTFTIGRERQKTYVRSKEKT